MKSPRLRVILFAAAVLAALACSAEAAPRVTVTVQREGSRVVYRYRIVNDGGRREITGLDLGALPGNDPVLRHPPVAVAAPAWRADVTRVEEMELWQVGWFNPERPVRPGQQRCGFAVYLDRETPEYAAAPFTVYFGDATKFGGIVQRDDSLERGCDEPAIALEFPEMSECHRGVVPIWTDRRLK